MDKLEMMVLSAETEVEQKNNRYTNKRSKDEG